MHGLFSRKLQEAELEMKAKSLHYSKSGCVQPIASEIGRVIAVRM